MKLLTVSRNTIQNLSYLSLAHIILILFGLLSSMIWARYTSIELFGKYQLLLSYLSLVTIFSIPGFSMSSQLSAAKEKHGNLSIIFKKRIQWSFLSTIILILIGLFYQFLRNDIETAYLLYIASFFFPIYNLKSIWESWLTAIGEYKKISLIQILFALVSIISLIISLILIGNIYIVIIITFGTISISNILVIKYFIKKSKNSIEDQKLICYGYQLSWAMVIPVIMTFDKILISEYLSIKDVAIYSIAMAFPIYIKTLYSIINRLITPSISSSDTVLIAWLYLKPKLLLISTLFFIIGIVGFLMMDSLIAIIYTSKYAESALYAKWLWLFITLGIPSTFLANILRSQQRLKFEFFSYLLVPIIKIGSLIVLVPLYSLWGAVYSIAITNILTSIYYICYFVYELKNE